MGDCTNVREKAVYAASGLPKEEPALDRTHSITKNMKTIISLLLGCSLGLAGAALAQQPVEQQSPSKSKHAPERARATEAQPRAKPAKPEERPANQTGAVKERGATNERSATNEAAPEKSGKTEAERESGRALENNVSREPTSGATNEPRTGKNRNARTREQSANASTDAAKQQTGQQQRKDVKGSAEAAKPPVNRGTTETNAVSPTGQQNAQAKAKGAVKKPAPQQVQQVKSQNANFRAQPKPQQVPSVTFNQNHRIEGSDHWQGQQYEVFRSYHPEWHDQGWYHSHYSNVVLIGGGYYFFNNGYWFPAWGYSPSAQYYPYDGPIYVGHSAEPPDKVIADTQALLQQMGYYTGEVDGLLGPLTRQALTAYQADQGLATTASIDEPTLDSLGLA
jgi:hypothetical protein